VKNTLAVVQAMASQTFRAEIGDPSKAVRKYQDRIASLAVAHDVLTENNWGPIRLGALVDGILERSDRASPMIAAQGPDVRLSPRQAVVVALGLNELLENARSHGALRQPSGKVAITWSRDAEDGFSFSWREAGGVGKEIPGHEGFGTSFLRSLGDEFDGTARLEYREDGLVFRLTGRLRCSARGSEM
jgi:two-component sensor histidine kinase